MIKKIPTINLYWSSLIIEELIRCGVELFCIAPGSRSSMLTVAAAENKRAKTLVHFDERGLAFHALGYVSATKRPCVIITTSGTAVANLFPSVIEASKKKIPLIILTADRPPELRYTGANQTIDQVKIFGDYVKWFFDFPTPTDEISPEFVLTTIDQLVYRAQSETLGPVHINCMFREPLTPKESTYPKIIINQKIEDWLKQKSPFTIYHKSESKIRDKDIAALSAKLRNIKSGIIAVGKLSSKTEQDAALKLAHRLGWPIFADVTSGLRLSSQDPNLIHYFDRILSSDSWKKKMNVDGVLHLGGRLTSKHWYTFIEDKKLTDYIMVLNHPLRNDPNHQVSARIHGRVGDFCVSIISKIQPRKPSALLNTCRKASGEID